VIVGNVVDALAAKLGCDAMPAQRARRKKVH